MEECLSNGTIESHCAREIQKQVRVMTSASEERLKSTHLGTRILSFLVEHAAKLMRYQLGPYVRTSHELHAGKPYRRQLVDFGARVHFLQSVEMRPKL